MIVDLSQSSHTEVIPYLKQGDARMAPSLKRLSPQVFVAGQIHNNDMDALAASGIRVVVNHRPDGEEPDQPTSESLSRAAESAGLRYLHAPITGLPHQQAVDATGEALRSLRPGESALLFCRSGMRSTAAWATAERLTGASADELRAAARAAGYDIERLPL